jgi:predicted amidohydrolase YtcJ
MVTMVRRIKNARLVGRPDNGVYDLEITDGFVSSILPVPVPGCTSSEEEGLANVKGEMGKERRTSSPGLDLSGTSSLPADFSIHGDDNNNHNVHADNNDDNDDEIDLEGRSYVAPSLMDNHVHFKWWALSESRIDLSSCKSAREVIQTIQRVLAKEYLGSEAEDQGLGMQERGPDPVERQEEVSGEKKKKPTTTWLVGQHMRMSDWPDLPSLTRSTLDALTTSYPDLHGSLSIVLIFNGFHSLVTNSAGLRRFGFGFDEEVELGLADSGEGNGHDGHLQETEAFAALGVMNNVDEEEVDEMVMRISRVAA